jgi:uncharacterized protein YndB with AHSA1/START domain
MSTMTVSLPSDREIRLTREFDSPRELVFEAFSKPEHLANWYGPRDMTIPVLEVDFRPGGAWHMVHRDGAGQEYGFRGEYREIVRPEKIVWTFEYLGWPGHVSVDSMQFEDLGDRTRLVGTSVFDTVEDRDGMLQSGMERGAAESYDRLAEYLLTLGGTP